ncbi:MAG: IS66 family transposase [Solobacterium sp.]|nr:IS66 family transposase [Solobacterium sp.]
MSDVNLSEKELNNMPKEVLVTMIMGLQSSVNELNRTVQNLSEQLKVMNSRNYGRKSEQVSALQMELELGFNDTEVTADPGEPEPTLEEAAPRKKRPVGKRAEDIKKITNHREEYIEIPEAELDQRFGKGKWKRLPYQIITKLEHIPASFEAVTYKIGVYAAADNETIIRAEKPVELWPNSIATPSLVASIIFGKYVNAVPLYRQEQTYVENSVFISRATMANWMIASYEKYLKYYYEVVHRKLLEQKYLHADETGVEVSKDGRKTGSMSYMWVYRTQQKKDVPQIVLYDYRMTRSHDHPRDFLRGFNGTLTTDGYQAYHALEKEDPETFKVSGCWVHTKRKYADAVKAVGAKSAKGTLAEQAVKKITKIFHENNRLDSLAPEERLKKRQEKIKPLVDEYFEWVRKHQPYVDSASQTGKAFTYSINQEKYLRTFLDDPNLDMDNNTAERAIRPFTIGRKNWVMIDTIRGANASACIYSLAETAKANNLKTYDYFRYLLTELPKYIHDFETAMPDSLFPWSEEFPKELFRK